MDSKSLAWPVGESSLSAGYLLYVKPFRRWIVEEIKNERVECTADGTISSGGTRALVREQSTVREAQIYLTSEGW